MRKPILLFILFFLSSEFCFSQDNGEKAAPIHFIKIDLFKSAFSQAHVDYERYNGKKGSFEIGLSVFYPNSFISGFTGSFYNRFKYTGGGVELKRKFYITQKRIALYVAPELSCKYRYYDHQDFLIGGHANSSFAVWYKASGHSWTSGLGAIVGFSTSLEKSIVFDLNAGPALGFVNAYRTINDYGRYDADVSSGSENHITLLFQFSAKVGFAIKGK